MADGKPATMGQPEEARERLLVEAAQIDPSRFAELYEIHFERVYAYVARRVRSRDTAEDVTSEVFHRALANLPRFKWRGAPFAAWLFRIAANLIADRSKLAGRELPEREESTNENSATIIEEIERRAQLFRLVNELPSDQRRVISMRFAEGASIREIANQLKRSEGAVKQLQFRALENLRAQLGARKSEQNG